MNEKQALALLSTLEYLYYDEAYHYVYSDNKADHIYPQLVVLVKFLYMELDESTFSESLKQKLNTFRAGVAVSLLEDSVDLNAKLSEW